MPLNTLAVPSSSGFSLREHAYLSIDKTYPSVLRSYFPVSSLGFVYLPSEISNGGQEPGWTEVEIIGRKAPYQVWGAVSAEEYSFTLQFFAENSYYDDVDSKVEWLKALKVPVMHQGISYRPPPLIFVWGSFINRRVILKSADPTFSGPWQVEGDGGATQSYPLYPLQASVSISLVTVD